MHPLSREFLDNVPPLDAKKVLPGGISKTFGSHLLAQWVGVVLVHDLLADEDSRDTSTVPSIYPYTAKLGH